MTILIKGAQIFDGTGKPPFKADVWVKGERIGALGNFAGKKADEVIEARGTGACLSPGFIDINTDSDHYLSLFTNPAQKDFLLQGATTIIGGNCGSSLAPLIKGSLQSVRKWTDTNAVNVNWKSVAEFLDVLEKMKLGVNFGTLIGHSTVRRDLIGELTRDLTPSELTAFKNVVRTGLEEGAFGLSTGLGYSHSKRVPYFEIAALASVISNLKKVYATHLRNETDGLLTSVKEALNIARESGVRTEISHFRPILGFEKQFEAALELISESAAAADVNFDAYPFETSAVSIYTLLPDWVSLGGFETILKNIETPAVKEKIKEALPPIDGRDITVAQAPGQEFLIGKTLEEFSKNQGLDVADGLIKLMKVTRLRAIVFYKNINHAAVIKSLSRAQTIVSSNGASLPEGKFLVHERSTSTFPVFLGTVQKENLMPLELAVYKITGLPAKKYGLKERGVIAEGKYADLTMFQGDKITNVIINGRLAVKNGEWQNAGNGKVLRSSV